MVTKLINALAFPYPERKASARQLCSHPGLVWLRTRLGDDIPAVYVQNTTNRAVRFLVLYSHGNAEDVGEALHYIERMSVTLQADVLVYEYPGYSISCNSSTGDDGSPSEAGIYAAAEAAYSWALRCQADGGAGVAPSDIIPFGRSLGSAPAIYLASWAAEPVGGLLLQSPLFSGASAFLGAGVARVMACIDPFRNGLRIAHVRCCVAICHGTADGVVPCWNGKALHKLCVDAYEPLWCKGHGHNDMDDGECLRYASAFLDHLATRLAGSLAGQK
mmetsp:Transcript_43020/g.71501  ORF Transcript_43020/g.71501 Transcript_43020/m.71501 type:complete len:275 (-) Transcript_43020:293-1117(-)